MKVARIEVRMNEKPEIERQVIEELTDEVGNYDSWPQVIKTPLVASALKGLMLCTQQQNKY